MKQTDRKRMIDADELIKRLENIDLYKEDKVGKFGVLKSILVVEEMASAYEEVKTISYEDCANAMLYMWMADILTDEKYNRIMDKLNAKKDGL